MGDDGPDSNLRWLIGVVVVPILIALIGAGLFFGNRSGDGPTGDHKGNGDLGTVHPSTPGPQPSTTSPSSSGPRIPTVNDLRGALLVPGDTNDDYRTDATEPAYDTTIWSNVTGATQCLWATDRYGYRSRDFLRQARVQTTVTLWRNAPINKVDDPYVTERIGYFDSEAAARAAMDRFRAWIDQCRDTSISLTATFNNGAKVPGSESIIGQDLAADVFGDQSLRLLHTERDPRLTLDQDIEYGDRTDIMMMRVGNYVLVTTATVDLGLVEDAATKAEPALHTLSTTT
jgi:hypothetical protein